MATGELFEVTSGAAYDTEHLAVKRDLEDARRPVLSPRYSTWVGPDVMHSEFGAPTPLMSPGFGVSPLTARVR